MPNTFNVTCVDKHTGLMKLSTLDENLSRILPYRHEAAACNASSLAAYARCTNSFLGTCAASFAQHYPLILSPDDVWLAVVQGFALHVNNNAEALRSRFVRHQGKKVIKLRRDNFVKGSPDNDWPGCFSEFSTKIREHVGPAIDVVVADFSTTGPIERAASEVTLMDAMQAYFEYRVRTMCGIPQVTLLGTVDDWLTVKARAVALVEYDLVWWARRLLPALDEFVSAAAGRPDVAAWDSFYNEAGGSGGTKITGWVNALFPYVMDYRTGAYTMRNEPYSHGNYHVETSNFPVGLSVAPFVWDYNGTEHDMRFVAGFVGVSQDADTGAVRPATGWAVAAASEKRSPSDSKDDYRSYAAV